MAAMTSHANHRYWTQKKFLNMAMPIANVSYLDRIGSFLAIAILTGPGERVLKELCLFRFAASNIAARSGNELDRRRLFLNDSLLVVCGFSPPSSCVKSLRMPNCFRNHFFVSGLNGGFRLPSLSMSFTDCTFALLVWLPDISTFAFMSSSCKTSLAGLFFFDAIVTFERKR